jgi:hypothetical protein
VSLFRRREAETLNEQLLREAGLEPGREPGGSPRASEPLPESAEPPLPTGRPRRARNRPSVETAVSTRAVGLPGDEIEFTTLPNGDIVVDQAEGDPDLSPLADAIERKVEPPYRAFAARQDGDLWGVGASRIQVAEFPFAECDEVVLTVRGGDREVRVDEEASDADVPELARLGEQIGADYCVEAIRIDGDFWEVRALAF